MPAIPLRGDRSTWDAGSYQSLHANDIDTSASAIHHTLGTSASQAASGTHTHGISTIGSGSSSTGQLLTSLGSGNLTWLSLTNHSHSGSTSGDGGKLDWDNIWLDAVHDHSGSVEGGKFNITNLSSGAAVTGYVLTADGSGSATWNPPSSTGNITALGQIPDVYVPIPNDGDVLTWNTATGSWVAFRAVDWRVNLAQDSTADDSDKTFTVPTPYEWQILWVWVEYISTATAGIRQLEIQLQDSNSNVIGQWQTGVTQIENLTYKYLFAIGVPDLTIPRDTNNVTTPLPAGTFLSAGQKLRVWDNNAVDASGDDMTVRLQYASRNLSLEYFYVPVTSNATQGQTSDKITLVVNGVLSVNNATQLQNSSNIMLAWRETELINISPTQAQTSNNITLSYHDFLLVDNPVHPQTSGSTALTQHNVLAIHNATMRQVSNKVTLAVDIVHNPEAIAQDSSQAQTVDNIILTAYMPFSVNNSSQTQTTSNIGLVTDMPTLGVNNSIQSQTSDKVPVNNRYILATISNTIHAESSEKIGELTLYQKALEVNNSSIRITSNKVTLYSP